MSETIYEIPVKRIDNRDTTLAEHKGNVLLIVNVASECGLTPQYEALEKVYEKYQDQGFEVLGFPANEFGAQEPGTNEEIKQFCETKFHVSFPMFSKIVVKGEGQHPIYKYLTELPIETRTKGDSFRKMLEQHGLVNGKPHDILWNFEKFLVNRYGQVIARFAPDIAPDDPLIIEEIEKALKINYE